MKFEFRNPFNPNSFDLKKRRSDEFLAATETGDGENKYVRSEGKIDQSIISLVTTLNSLPFAYTFSSCSGHFRKLGSSRRGIMQDRTAMEKNPGKEMIKFKPGHIMFTLKDDETSRAFLEQLENFLSTLPIAKLIKLPEVAGDSSQPWAKNSWSLDFGGEERYIEKSEVDNLTEEIEKFKSDLIRFIRGFIQP